MHIFFELADLEFRGSATWRDDQGFTAKLNTSTFDGGQTLRSNLPKLLLARVDEYRTVVLIEPRVTSSGWSFDVNSPSASYVTIHARAMIEKLPWDFNTEAMVESFSVSSTGIQIWRGCSNLRIDMDWEKRKGKAEFECTCDRQATILGEMKIKQNLKMSDSVNSSKIEILSTSSIKIEYQKEKNILKCFSDIFIVEGYFDLLSAFPCRDANAYLIFSGDDNLYPLQIAWEANEITIDPNLHYGYLSYDNLSSIESTFNKYCSNFDKYKTVQSTIRWLSNNSITLPEGFLMACNVIEKLGRNIRNNAAELNDALDSIEHLLQKSDVEKYDLFRRRIRPQVQTGPSFRDRFEYMVQIFSNIGIAIMLSADSVSKRRGKFRHDVYSINTEDQKLMSEMVDLTWFYGLNWLCLEIGISQNMVRNAACSNRFHTLRPTRFSTWGKMSADVVDQ